MTKRELITALEATSCPDDTLVKTSGDRDNLDVLRAVVIKPCSCGCGLPGAIYITDVETDSSFTKES